MFDDIAHVKPTLARILIPREPESDILFTYLSVCFADLDIRVTGGGGSKPPGPPSAPITNEGSGDNLAFLPHLEFYCVILYS